VNTELETTWKDAGVAQFEVMFRYMPRGSEGNHKYTSLSE
jgi:hypothetical protein